ncbi:hypothetical protein CYY_009059 [Polysphondylium violaceum]|uniref:IPT/TIG domain-containing protein n=1 Tax=Polysphondylium violaceum TaxID=133409 RepID=A0A8J4PKN2_9MYCE|nr:hypothetical protein CYY_009059 [Polysphondylium violaceum]
MTDSHRHEIIKYLSIIQHLGTSHLKTIGGFVQRPTSSSSAYAHVQEQPVSLLPSNNGEKTNEALYNLSSILERLDDNQFDDIIFYLTKQVRSPLDQQEINRLMEISTQLKVSLEYISAIGRIYQSFLLFELLTLYCSEDHITKISEALTAVFPLPVDVSEDQEILSTAQTILKTQNYLTILQKLQQLFTRTNIDSLLHLQQEINNSVHGNNNNIYGVPSNNGISLQQICETLEIKTEEYFLASCLKILLQTDELTLTSLVDSFPKFQPLQLIQLSLLPFKNIYEILDLKSNLCSLSSTFQFYTPLPVSLTFNYQLPDPSKPIELKVVDQPPEKAVYRRNVKPPPSVMFEGDSKLLNGNYYVHTTLLRCNNFAEEPTFLKGNALTLVGCGKVVTFKKLKILVTSHQQGETLFCFRFDLRNYRSDPTQNPDDFELVSSTHSNPICVLSHSTQLKTTASDLPQIQEIVPESGPSTGGTRIAILGSNFADTPATRVKFDNIEVEPHFHSSGTLVVHAPQHAPGPVQVKVSNSPKCWSTTYATFTYEDQSTIATPNEKETTSLNLPKSAFGLDFSSSFASNFLIKGLDVQNSNNSSNSFVYRNSPSSSNNRPTYYSKSLQQQQQPINQLNQRGFGMIHYAAAFGELTLLSMILLAKDSMINLVDKYGNTALHWAVEFNQKKAIELLLASRCSPNAQNHLGKSPIHLATKDVEITKTLIKFGANFNCTDIDGITPLHISSAQGHVESLEFLLKDCNANIYYKDDQGETSLHYAIREEQSQCIQLLLKHAEKIEENRIENSLNYSAALMPFFEKEDDSQDEDEDDEDQPLVLMKNDDFENAIHLSLLLYNNINLIQQFISTKYNTTSQSLKNYQNDNNNTTPTSTGNNNSYVQIPINI